MSERNVSADPYPAGIAQVSDVMFQHNRETGMSYLSTDNMVGLTIGVTTGAVSLVGKMRLLFALEI